jgi:ribosomal protein L11 methyltransferase
MIAAAVGKKHANALVHSTLAQRDWVAASLAALAPVHAGRFIVHGAHDRAHTPAHRIGIEIEAALAFGTGHHGTTRGCLLALDALLKRKNPRRAV